jgi:hypothetical protein
VRSGFGALRVTRGLGRTVQIGRDLAFPLNLRSATNDIGASRPGEASRGHETTVAVHAAASGVPHGKA